MTTTENLEAIVLDLQRELAELRRAQVALEDRHRQLDAEHRALLERSRPASPVAGPSTDPVDHRRSRRDLLRTAGAAAAGGAAALALGTAEPAAAANGGSVIIGANGGSANTGTASTELRTTGGTNTFGLLVVQDGSFTGSSHPSAVSGFATGAAVDDGVYGYSNVATGNGVIGRSDFGTGVRGVTTSGVGVWGIADDPGLGSVGVYANNQSGKALQATGVVGVGASGSQTALRLYSDGIHLAFTPQSTSPPTRSDLHQLAEVHVDAAGDLWYCVSAGTPGTWRRLAGPSSAGALAVLPSPVRVYDSRPGTTPAVGTKAPLVPSIARAVDLKANGSNVPSGATAALVSLVATNTTGASGGWLSIYRNGIAWPGTSNLNWSSAGQTVAVTTLTSVNITAVANLYANVATDVIVDVLGYYR